MSGRPQIRPLSRRSFCSPGRVVQESPPVAADRLDDAGEVETVDLALIPRKRPRATVDTAQRSAVGVPLRSTLRTDAVLLTEVF